MHQRAVELGAAEDNLQVGGVGQTLRRRRPRQQQGNDCLLPNRDDPRTWFVLRELLGHQNVKELRRQLDGNTAPWWAPPIEFGKLICALDPSKD